MSTQQSIRLTDLVDAKVGGHAYVVAEGESENWGTVSITAYIDNEEVGYITTADLTLFLNEATIRKMAQHLNRLVEQFDAQETWPK